MQSDVTFSRQQCSSAAPRPAGKRSAAGRGAAVSTLPDGNHGDNLQPTVAALFVRKVNHYAAHGVDCFDFDRDALTWRGGCPGIFHPPCRAWGRLRTFAKPRDGERELALWAVDMARKNGGVVEHPMASGLWRAAGCRSFGVRDDNGGVLIPVLQGWWGHRAPKPTCFYVVGPVPALPEFAPLEAFAGRIENMGRAERERTPAPLATWLIDVAKACA